MKNNCKIIWRSNRSFVYSWYMNKEIVQQVINEVYPKIVNHYGEHKYGYNIPKVEVHNNIFARISGIKKMQGDVNPSGEFCKETDKIFIYFPYIKSKVDLIKALLHEYRHYLQPCWDMNFILKWDLNMKITLTS